MKEYIGNRSKQKIIIDGDNIYLKNPYYEENCTFSDITEVNYNEPTSFWELGTFHIFTKNQTETHFAVGIPKKDAAKYTELFYFRQEKAGLASEQAPTACPDCGANIMGETYCSNCGKSMEVRGGERRASR